MSKLSKSDFITSIYLLNQYINKVLIDRGWNFNYQNNEILTHNYVHPGNSDDHMIFNINRDKFFHKDHDATKRSKIFEGWTKNVIKTDTFLFEVLLSKFMDFLNNENNKHFLNKYYPYEYYNHKHGFDDNVSKMIIQIGEFDDGSRDTGEATYTKDTHYQLTLREGKKGIGNKIKLHLDIDLFDHYSKNVDKNIKQYIFDKP